MLTNILRITSKELLSFFSSITAFLFFAAFLCVTLFVFFWVDTFFARNVADVRPMFEWMPVLLIVLVPALTMRMWSEERRTGTIEFLLTLPLSNLELVMGKFLACLGLVAIALALTLPLPISVSFFAGQLDWGPVIGGYLAALFLAASYTAIGLFVSACTVNQIVSLLLSVLLCSAFYLVGTDSLTSLFNENAAFTLKLLGTGSRFQSITRGVIDFRDLYYYLTISACFLIMNVEELQSLRWAGNKGQGVGRRWTLISSLLAFNFVAANFWLQQISWARLDLTEGQIYSVSSVTRKYIDRLQEPLLIRCYFSKKTHPALQPLMPRLRDLLKEYAIAGKGKIRLEFLDPLEKPELEKEAVEKYGIKPVAFQTANKYQAAVTNSYFDLLFKYGDQYKTLSWKDLIEIKASKETNIDVDLRNPEYDISSCIKKLISSYQSSGNVFESIDKPVTFTAYFSDDNRLPEPLVEGKAVLEKAVEALKAKSGGKFAVEFVNPDKDKQKAEMLQKRLGLRALSMGILDPRSFWYYMVLSSGDQLIQVQLPEEPSKEAFERNIQESLRRFSKGYLKTIGLFAPHADLPPGVEGDSFDFLKGRLEDTYTVKHLDLLNGIVPADVDLLLMVAPDSMNEKQVFAVDQFLMKGGTVIYAGSPFDVQLRKTFDCRPLKSGMEEWLKTYGVEMEKRMVLDSQNFPLLVPVQRQAAGYTLIDTQLAPYPYFVDIRGDGMPSKNSPTSGLNQLILQWASPLKVDKDKNKSRHLEELIFSSPKSWTSDAQSLMPDYKETQKMGFAEGKDKGRQLLALALEGSFESFYKGKRSPLLVQSKEKQAKSKDKMDEVPGSVIEKSPDSARLILYCSNAFLTDKIIYMTSESIGTKYMKPLDLILNSADWSLEDRELLSIRSRGHFTRTLRPLNHDFQLIFEYANYGLAALGLLFVWVLRRQVQVGNKEKYQLLKKMISLSKDREGLKA